MRITKVGEESKSVRRQNGEKRNFDKTDGNKTDEEIDKIAHTASIAQADAQSRENFSNCTQTVGSFLVNASCGDPGCKEQRR